MFTFKLGVSLLPLHDPGCMKSQVTQECCRVLFLQVVGSPSAAFLSTVIDYKVCTWVLRSHYLPTRDLRNTYS